ncbi:LOW QUALITY PROTEIN: Protein CBG08868, partial [Caenorhabditis briggsae]
MNCLDSPPETYRFAMHLLQLISNPTYFISLISLILIKSNVFTTYKHFLIWHTLHNFFFEVYSIHLVEPALHAPHTLMRTTGILSKAGVGSLVQTYMLSLGLEYNALTISEMFWFRYKVSVINYREQKHFRLLQQPAVITRFIAVFATLTCILTYNDGLRFQQEHKSRLLELYPSDTFILCDSVYLLVAFGDYTSSVFVAIWIFQSLLSILMPATFFFINMNIPQTVSETTMKLQHQLLRSLIIMATLHLVFLGIPNVMFVYAFLFGYENEGVAYIAFICVTYHGFASCLAMIIFTKPLRSYILRIFK